MTTALSTTAATKGWRPTGTPILNALLEHVPGETDRRPWQPGVELNVHGQGGLVSEDRRRFTIIGHGEYTNHVGGCRTLAANRQGIRTTKQLTTRIAPGATTNGRSTTGHDSLTVDGDAELTFGGRLVMMSGILNRQWNGGVMRLASMEGVICGGGFLRLIASPSATISGLNTGDVYGGCARVSAVRSYLAVLQYRAAQTATWTSAIYNRTATFVIEPVVGTPSANPVSNTASKLARLGRTFEMARMLCPVLDILVGVVTFVPLGIYAIYRLISSVVRKPVPAPLTGPPRIRNQTAPVRISSYQTVLTT